MEAGSARRAQVSTTARKAPFRKTLFAYLAVMGPGIITSAADNDAGGITTYSICGAHFGYALVWLLIPITVVLAMVQEMCARMGAVTQKGLGELIREEFGVRWTLFALVVMLVANVATTVAEFAGIAASLQMFGVHKAVSVIVSGLIVWLLVTRFNFRAVERVFLAATLIFVTYIIAGFMAGPDWGEVARAAVTPVFHKTPEYILLVIATIGTTVTPWMQFFLQSTVVDKGIKIRQYRYQKADVFFGAFLTDFVAFFIIVATAATLYTHGIRIESAEHAAKALEPFAGANAKLLFAIGLFNASLLASAVLPLTTAYTYCESFGWEIGLSRSWREAPMFYGIFTFTLVIGAAVVLLPGLHLITAMILSQDVNGILLPVVLIFMLKLVNNREIMGHHTNSPVYNIVCWATVVLIILLTVALLAASFLHLPTS